MNKYILIAVVLIGTFLIHHFLTKFLVKKYTYKLMSSITKDEESFVKELDSFMVKYLFPVYNREFFRLNYYIINIQHAKVKEQFAKLEQIKMTNNQRLALYQTIFKYFVSVNKKTDAKNLLRKLNAFVDENNLDSEIKKQYEMEYKIYLEKDIKAISYIDSLLENCEDVEKAVHYLEKTYIYKENNQLDLAKECMKQVISYTPDEKQKQAFQELLDNNLKDL